MPTPSNPYLTTLTPLRGMAALLVVIYHCNSGLMPFLPPGDTHFLESGYLCVDFFFILSGFVMCYAYSKYFNNGVTRDDYKKFICARFARIYPLYFVAVMLSFLCAVIIHHYATSLDPFFAELFNLKALPSCLLLIQSLHIYKFPPLNVPSWSLSTEWWVYLLFPFLVPLFTDLKTPGKVIATAAIVVFYMVLKYVLGPLDANTSGRAVLDMIDDFGLLRCLAGFLLGMLMFTFYEYRDGVAFIKCDWFFTLSFLGAIIAMHFGSSDIVIVAFFPFILLAAAYNESRVKRVLDTYLLQRLGDWSYSIYLMHGPVISLFLILGVKMNPLLFADLKKLMTQKPNYVLGMVMAIIAVLLTMILAALTYRFIEVPARNYLNKAFNTKHKQVLPESVEV